MDDAVADIEEEDNATDALEDGKRRRPRYAQCTAVPSVLHVDIPRMGCEGKVVPAHAMKVASTANYGSVVEFELTAANVEYFYNALAAAPPSYFIFEQAARKKRRCFKLKPMYSDTPDVVERSDGYPHPMAVTSYVDVNGRRHQHTQRLKVLDEHRQLGTEEENGAKWHLQCKAFGTSITTM